jgi:hypothetical protein
MGYSSDRTLRRNNFLWRKYEVFRDNFLSKIEYEVSAVSPNKTAYRGNRNVLVTAFRWEGL